jgi:hypothetical protein
MHQSFIFFKIYVIILFLYVFEIAESEFALIFENKCDAAKMATRRGRNCKVCFFGQISKMLTLILYPHTYVSPTDQQTELQSPRQFAGFIIFSKWERSSDEKRLVLLSECITLVPKNRKGAKFSLVSVWVE